MRIAIISALIMCTLSFGEGKSNKISLPEELQGNIVPKFSLLAPNNETRHSEKDLAEEAKKLGAKRVVFSFFATWCEENCGPEFVHLKENAAKLKEKGVLVYLIDVGEELMKKGEDVRKFVDKYADNKFPYYFDQNAKLLKNYGILAKNAKQAELPVLWVMDADLRVLHVFKGTGDDFPQILWEDL